MFIQTESTPNPETLKFIPGCPVMGRGRIADFFKPEDADRSPLAAALFKTGVVARIFFGEDFLSVTKSAGEWPKLKPVLLEIIAEHFASGAPLITALSPEPDDAPEGEQNGAPDSEIVAQIKELLESRVRPALAGDGGGVQFVKFDEAAGIVFLRLRGACAGCPSATITMKQGIETLLRHFVPEVNAVESV